MYIEIDSNYFRQEKEMNYLLIEIADQVRNCNSIFRAFTAEVFRFVVEET